MLDSAHCASVVLPREHIAAMRNEFTAVVQRDGPWWVGWIEEVPGVNCQEPTHDELISSLQITLKEALEFNRQDTLAAVGAGYREEKIAI